MIFLLLLLAGAAVGGYFYWEYAKQYESTDDAFLDAHVVRMDAKISGYIVELLVTDNQLVAAGDLLVKIDPRDYQAALDQAKAAEDAARAEVKRAETQIEQSKAARGTAESNIASAVAASKRDTAELKRLDRVKNTGALSGEEYDVGVAAAASSQAMEESARAKLREAEATIATSEAALVAAKSQLEEANAATRAAEVTLSYTNITAPIAGRVTRRTIERGDLVQPGSSLFAFVDPNPWVNANFKETQLTLMHPGQAVTVSIDAYPDRELSASSCSARRN